MEVNFWQFTGCLSLYFLTVPGFYLLFPLIGFFCLLGKQNKKLLYHLCHMKCVLAVTQVFVYHLFSWSIHVTYDEWDDLFPETIFGILLAWCSKKICNFTCIWATFAMVDAEQASFWYIYIYISHLKQNRRRGLLPYD